MKYLFSISVCLLFIFQGLAQTSSLTVQVKTDKDLKGSFQEKGRILLFLNQNSKEPRRSTWPNKTNLIFATNIESWNFEEAFVLSSSLEMVSSRDISLSEIPNGKYYIQVVWDQDFKESRINAPGNLYSTSQQIEVKGDAKIEIAIDKIIPPRKIAEHKLIKEVDIKSEILSEWWGKEMRLKAAVVLPRNYFNENKKYPTRINIAGYGGRYTRVSRFLGDMDWWQSEKAPEVLNIYLDGEGPFGDSYQLDSENSGPYGKALTEELIPYIEKKYRAIGSPETRFVDGCSTGGWVSLALQLFYPDYFGGCFSYSPDQVDFTHCQLVNIYKDKNAFINEHGYLRPLVRDTYGEPIISQKDFIQYENVLGHSNTFVTSGGQYSAFNALFSPKGEDGLPAAIFHPTTGEIDKEVAEHWRKYDLKDFAEKNWKTLGPKIQGKIWIWGADMDNFYLNPALRSFDEMIKKMDNPKSDAEISFTPMARHCQEYSNRKVLLQIQKKLEELK